jgi:RNA polymerase sigma factor (sigma-70 family)
MDCLDRKVSSSGVLSDARMSGFRPLTETELTALRPDELISYHHEARRLGRHDEARTALGILVWGFMDRIRYWVSRSIPQDQVEDVAEEVIASALVSSFRGTEVRQFGAWLRRIASRRAADFLEARSRGPERVPLPEEHEGDEDIWGRGGEVPDPTQEIVERSVVSQALDELSDAHRRVVELAGAADLGFEQRPAKETAEMVTDQLSAELGDPMTDVNVHQILSRFRRRVVHILEADNRVRGDG